MKTLGQQIKQTRLELGMSQTDLAEKAGVCQSSISHVENGRRSGLKVQAFRAIEKVLGVRLEPEEKESGTSAEAFVGSAVCREMQVTADEAMALMCWDWQGVAPSGQSWVHLLLAIRAGA